MVSAIFRGKATLGFFLGLVALLALFPLTKSWAVGMALFLGAAVGNVRPSAVPPELGSWRKITLNTAVVLFGFGLDIRQVLAVGSQGFWQTAVSLGVVLALGFALRRFFSLPPATTKLITVGTAICGGSAIAAVSSVMKARDEEVGVAMGVVFLLNTVALLAFPLLAKMTSLSPEQYGVWCALSIHDTSSVVGAAAFAGDGALSTATILKLTRTLWITPLVFALSLLEGGKGKFSVPPFILLFLLASIIASALPFAPLFGALASLGKVFMAEALFLVGLGLRAAALQRAGWRGVLFGGALWAVSLGVGFGLASGS
ncbi:MAG TPA: putative sulfate exporter family transporter [Synergistaceae bacterium]|nr:putative sulfate exporter family transporter [Synergistaceae bacterium]HQF90568.1 putative sulfate exporter family transporter [Synergistaceae bacterium]HQH79383.1 putative sulfate exporter family transporter [Synergistaceae bacterium]HQK25502.1 putative sulfate exporter family transporter [Synergistaceae bacterium]